MAEPTPFNLTDAVKPNGFIDFYQMLGVSPDTPTDAIRSRVNELYAEAQANRDHRNLNKRKEYQSLLEYLPHARTALLDTDKRAQYDAYAVETSAGAPAQTFEAFMGDLSGAAAPDADRTDVLGVQDGSSATSAATTRKTPTASTPRPRQTVGSSAAKQSLTGTAISVGVFFVLLIVLNLVLHNLPMAVLIAAVVGAVTWFLTHRGSKVGL